MKKYGWQILYPVDTSERCNKCYTFRIMKCIHSSAYFKERRNMNYVHEIITDFVNASISNGEAQEEGNANQAIIIDLEDWI